VSWSTLKSTKKADFPLFKVFEDVVKLPNGLKLDYYRVEKIPVVVVLPVLSDKIVMVNQYRYPIKSDSLELPAGHVWPDEDPRECALRELKEETGFTAGKIEKILEYHPSTEYADQVYHIFIAEDLKDGDTNHEKHELIDIEILEKDLVTKKIMDGDITDGRTITSIFLAHFLNRI
jgi:ADP-ribose pyrophosphatase